MGGWRNVWVFQQQSDLYGILIIGASCKSVQSLIKTTHTHCVRACVWRKEGSLVVFLSHNIPLFFVFFYFFDSFGWVEPVKDKTVGPKQSTCWVVSDVGFCPSVYFPFGFFRFHDISSSYFSIPIHFNWMKKFQNHIYVKVSILFRICIIIKRNLIVQGRCRPHDDGHRRCQTGLAQR